MLYACRQFAVAVATLTVVLLQVPEIQHYADPCYSSADVTVNSTIG